MIEPSTGLPGAASSWSTAAPTISAAPRTKSPLRRRRRRAQIGHGDVADGHAGLGEDQAGLQPVAVVDERRDRADEVAHHRPAAELFGPAGNRGGHLHGRHGEPPALHHAHEVLARVVPAGLDLVELGRLAAVAGTHGGPPVADGAEAVLHARDGLEVGLGRRPPLAGVPVDDLHATAVGGAVGPAEAGLQVAGRVAGAERELPRRLRERFFDEPAGQADEGRALVRVGAAFFRIATALGDSKRMPVVSSSRRVASCSGAMAASSWKRTAKSERIGAIGCRSITLTPPPAQLRGDAGARPRT